MAEVGRGGRRAISNFAAILYERITCGFFAEIRAASDPRLEADSSGADAGIAEWKGSCTLCVSSSEPLARARSLCQSTWCPSLVPGSPYPAELWGHVEPGPKGHSALGRLHMGKPGADFGFLYYTGRTRLGLWNGHCSAWCVATSIGDLLQQQCNECFCWAANQCARRVVEARRWHGHTHAPAVRADGLATSPWRRRTSRRGSARPSGRPASALRQRKRQSTSGRVSRHHVG